MSQPTFNADSVPDTTHHHMHADNEPLPTTADRTTDYSTQALEGTGTALPEQRHTGVTGKVERGAERAMENIPAMPTGAHHDTTEQKGMGAMDNTRAADAHGANPPTVGASTTGRKVSVGDKILGKTQEVRALHPSPFPV